MAAGASRDPGVSRSPAESRGPHLENLNPPSPSSSLQSATIERSSPCSRRGSSSTAGAPLTFPREYFQGDRGLLGESHNLDWQGGRHARLHGLRLP